MPARGGHREVAIRLVTPPPALSSRGSRALVPKMSGRRLNWPRRSWGSYSNLIAWYSV